LRQKREIPGRASIDGACEKQNPTTFGRESCNQKTRRRFPPGSPAAAVLAAGYGPTFAPSRRPGKQLAGPCVKSRSASRPRLGWRPTFRHRNGRSSGIIIVKPRTIHGDDQERWLNRGGPNQTFHDPTGRQPSVAAVRMDSMETNQEFLPHRKAARPYVFAVINEMKALKHGQQSWMWWISGMGNPDGATAKRPIVSKLVEPRATSATIAIRSRKGHPRIWRPGNRQAGIRKNYGVTPRSGEGKRIVTIWRQRERAGAICCVCRDRAGADSQWFFTNPCYPIHQLRRPSWPKVNGLHAAHCRRPRTFCSR